MISVDLRTAMRVGVLVMVTASVMDQNAVKVMTADTRRTTAEVRGRESGSEISLLGRKRLEMRERMMEKTPVINMRWLLVILSLVFMTLTLMTFERAVAMAT